VAVALVAGVLTVAACGTTGDDGGAPSPVGGGLGAVGVGSTVAPTTVPGAPADPAKATQPPTPVTLAFAGDIHFAGSSGQRLAADPKTAVGPMSAVLSQADLAVANLETAVTTGGVPAPGKEFVFRAPPSAFTALRAAGIDVVSMANNHGMDYGVEGLQDSLRSAREASFPVIGVGVDEAAAFAPFLATVHGRRIAVIGATQVLDDELAAAWTAGPGKPGLASAKNVNRLVAAVRAARAAADTVVVFLHWGLERANCPISAQTSLIAPLAEAGADVIVGSHAHVLLGGGWRPDGVYVHYGLGNFVFYVPGDGPNTETGMLELTVAGRSVTAATWVPGRISGGAPFPLTADAATAAVTRWEALRGCTGLAGVPQPRLATVS
jgi:poly-gamma-glutamate synthesis protein (capsule biosynthesis protein)